MQFSGYDPRHDVHIAALTDELSNADVQRLHNVLRNMRRNGWRKWLLDNAKPVGHYLFSTDAERKKQRQACSEDHRVLLQYGAIWQAQLAAATRLEFQDLSIQDPKDTRSRRAARAAIGLRALRAFLFEMREWQFDEPPDNPFED